MQFLLIEVDDNLHEITDFLKEKISSFSNKEFSINIKSTNIIKPYSVICEIFTDQPDYSAKQLYEELIIYVSNALADYIIKFYEEILIRRVINCNYCYFNPHEKKTILDTALLFIKNNEKYLLNDLFRIKSRNLIIRRLLDYFELSNSIILEGFVNFRLKDYIKELEEIIDKAVDEFIMEREYLEFIRLLKYFVDIQTPKCETVHLLVQSNRYILLDQTKCEIANDYTNEFLEDTIDDEFSNDDMLISILISIAPKKLVIHDVINFYNKELLKTINSIFKDKISFCSDCEICKLKSLNNQYKH